MLFFVIWTIGCIIGFYLNKRIFVRTEINKGFKNYQLDFIGYYLCTITALFLWPVQVIIWTGMKIDGRDV